MKRNPCMIHLTLTTLALISLALPGRAQQSGQDLVPFKASLKTALAQVTGFSVPGNPSVLYENLSFTGTVDLLGQVTYTARHTVPQGVVLPWGFSGVAAMVAANGDALYFAWYGLLRPAEAGITGDSAFWITGGSGRFLGARGSGALKAEIVPAKGEVTFTWDGMISPPKP